MKCSAWKEICTSNDAAVSKYRSPTSMIGCNLAGDRTEAQKLATAAFA
jgi:hypothetical protein